MKLTILKWTVVFLVLVLAACAAPMKKGNGGSVLCPACGHEFVPEDIGG